MGLPATAMNFRHRNTLHMAKKEVKVENINQLFLPSSTSSTNSSEKIFMWRPDYLPNLSAQEKMEVEEI